MPKRIPQEAKRVALNCLVLPETKEFLGNQECSQGEAVDRAVATLRAAFPQPVIDGLLNQGRGKQDPTVPMWKQFKSPLLKPSEKKR
jgi:hypothetical protein